MYNWGIFHMKYKYVMFQQSNALKKAKDGSEVFFTYILHKKRTKLNVQVTKKISKSHVL